MNRRDLLKNVVLGVAGTFVPAALKAEQNCAPLTPFISRCTAGIPSGSLDVVQAYQKMPEWCWAACIQMLFTYWGHPVDQKRIVKETWGSIVNMPGQPQQILADLNRDWKDDNGEDFTSQADSLSVNAATAVVDLKEDRPLIIGALGHATVLTALTSDVNTQNGAWNVIAATVRDPLPGNGGKRILSPQEWYNINFGARVLVS
jgi:Papain-like cysteine protease AvrRpt2